MGDRVLELPALRGRRELAVIEQIAGLDEVAMFGELLDRIAAIEQNAFVAIDIGDLRFAGRRRGEARIVGEDLAVAVELGDVDDIGPKRPMLDREVQGLAFDGQSRRCCRVGHVCLLASRSSSTLNLTIGTNVEFALQGSRNYRTAAKKGSTTLT